MRWILRVSATFALLAVATFTPAALAGPEQDKAQARQLAIDGVRAFDAGDYPAAVARFEAAEKLFHAPTHLLYVARGQAKLGQLVAARDTYRTIEREPLEASASSAFKKAQIDAAEERAALEEKIPTVVVRVLPDGLEGVEVSLDGARVEGAELGGARVDPGGHRLEAKTPNRTAPPIDFEVALGEKREIVLDFGSPAEPSPKPPPPPAPEPSGGFGTMTILGFTGIGVGAVGIGVGAVLSIVSLGKGSDADALYDQCGGRACPAGSPDALEVQSLDDDAATLGTVGVLSLGLGAAFAATGVVLLVVGDDEAPPSDARVEVAPSLGGGFLRGRF